MILFMLLQLVMIKNFLAAGNIIRCNIPTFLGEALAQDSSLHLRCISNDFVVNPDCCVNTALGATRSLVLLLMGRVDSLVGREDGAVGAGGQVVDTAVTRVCVLQPPFLHPFLSRQTSPDHPCLPAPSPSSR